MKFRIARTSEWDALDYYKYIGKENEEPFPSPPCPSAALEELKYGEDYYYRKLQYTVELDTLQDLLDLQKEVGEKIIIVANEDCYDEETVPPTPCIEIYDRYRE